LHERKTLETEIHIHVICPQLVNYVANDYFLDAKEIERRNAFIFEKDRNLYQAAHVFLRKMLSQYADINPECWMFTSNHFGKPAIKNVGQEFLSFNLSHTHGMIVCAIGYKHDLGIDIEGSQALPDLADLCRLTLADHEKDHVLSMPLGKQEKVFYRYWTLKEAYVKALGKGLTIPLTKIKYEVKKNGNWLCSVDIPESNDDLYALYYDLPENYSLAFCAKITERDHLPKLRLFNWNHRSHSEYLNFNVGPKFDTTTPAAAMLKHGNSG